MVQNLLRVPRDDKSFESATTTCPTAQYINQVDLLFLPEDDSLFPRDKERSKTEFKKVNEMLKSQKKEPLKKILVIVIFVSSS
jgi:hypothetical protein